MEVTLSSHVKKQLNKVPQHIVKKLLAWASFVRERGLPAAQIIKGYHDEPLKGHKAGLRSIRLSKQWRAEYSIRKNEIEFILVEDVHPHEYKK